MDLGGIWQALAPSSLAPARKGAPSQTSLPQMEANLQQHPRKGGLGKQTWQFEAQTTAMVVHLGENLTLSR